MNIEIANKLVELRKKKGMSQEEIAEKLGLSRQAVSRWERAESSPDISNLANLCKLYEVSLDDLLDTNMTSEKEEKDTVINDTSDKSSFTDNEESKSKGDKEDIVLAQIPFPFVIPVFIIWGLFGFHEGYNWFGKHKPNAMQKFPFPICVVSIYLLVSIPTGAWYITWLILMTIPVYFIIAALIKRK